MARNDESKSLLRADQEPHFVIEARPEAVLPVLAALPADTPVTYESGIKRWHLRGSTNAGQLRDQVMETITRQREGYFTLDEAAQILADSQPAVNPVEAVKRFRLAHQKGHLTIRQGGSRFPREVGENISDFHDLLEVRALDEWLRASVGYGFPSTAWTTGSPRPDGAPSRGSVHAKRWTKDALDELVRIRNERGTKGAAQWAGISTQRVRQLLPRDEHSPRANDPFGRFKGLRR